MTDLRLVRIGDTYRGTVDLPEIQGKKKTTVHTIAIIDNSGSMSSYIQYVNKMLVNMYYKLGYKDTDVVDVITFNSYVRHNTYAVWDIEKKIRASGGTNMAEVPSVLQHVIKDKDITDLRLIIFSDGDVWDGEKSIQNIEYLKNNFINKVNIHCITVRVMNSADTKALATWMNINTIGQPEMIQITYDNLYAYDDMAHTFYEKFAKDNMGSPLVELITDKDILQRTPFSTKSKIINLRQGRNEFWLTDIPNVLVCEGLRFEIKVEELSAEEYITYMSTVIEEYTQKLKILKLVDNDEARQQTTEIMEFFTKVDAFINSKQDDVSKLLERPGLVARREYLKQMALKSKKSFLNQMREIANDDNITKLSSAQQAEWMQTKFINKSNAKRVAKAMEVAGGDFDSMVREEAHNIHKHLPELKKRLVDAGVKEEDLTVSFVSQESVLDGLEALSDCVEDGSVDELGHLDLLKLVSIVGIAANGVTGAHPDPMTYRLNEVFPGCFVSVSDLMMVNEYNMDMDGGYDSDDSCESYGSSKKYLTPPGMPDKKINTCVPVVHPVIFRFMKRWCYHILELSAGFGMRGFIGEIPMTNSYTIATGLWSMVYVLDKNKSELTIKTFNTLKETFSIAIGKFFDHVLAHFHDQPEDVSFYIGNNGISNMLSPIIKQDGDNTYMHRVYSALYMFEFYQKTRRLIARRNRDRPDLERQDLLNKLFRIDLDNKTPKLSPLFEPDTSEPDWYSMPVELNLEMYTSEFQKEFWWVQYCVLLRDFFNGDTAATLSPEYIKSKLHLEYDIVTYEFFNLIAALLYPNKKSRVEEEEPEDSGEEPKSRGTPTKGRMLVPEFIGPGGYERGLRMCRDYVMQQYRNKWMARRTQKKKDETYKLTDDLVRQLVNTEDITEYVNLFRNGIKRGTTTVEVKNPGIVFPVIKERLLDPNVKMPLREEKLLIFLTGRTVRFENETVVWNNGEPLSDRRTIYSEALKQLPDANTERVREAIAQMKGFLYRSGRSLEELVSKGMSDWTNRHGHGITIVNGEITVFESFYALSGGECNSLEAYRKTVSEEEFNRYCTEHSGCCGVSQLNK